MIAIVVVDRDSSPDKNAPRLVVEAGRHAGQLVTLGRGVLIIGRSSKCGLALKKSAGVSRQHTQIELRGGAYYVQDLDSRNGTYVNGEEILGRYPLNDGDLVEISDERIRYFGPSGRSLADAIESVLTEQRSPRPPSLPEPDPLPSSVASPPPSASRSTPMPTPPRPRAAQAPSSAPPAMPVPQDRSPSLPRPAAPITPPLPASQQAVHPPMAPLPQAPPRRGGCAFILGLGIGLFLMVAGVAALDFFLNDAATIEEVTGLKLLQGMGSPSDVPVDVTKDLAPSRDAGIASAADLENESRPDAGPAPPAVNLTQIRSPSSGILSDIVSVGVRVKKGQRLFRVKPAMSAAQQRKLKSLKAEERSFKKAAATGDRRAAAGLTDVRRDLAAFERRVGSAKIVRSPTAGVVKNAKKRGSVARRDVVVEIAP